MSRSIDVSNSRRQRKLNLIQILGGKCQICGFDDFPDALEFHHENPNEKEYGLSSGNCHNLEQDLIEIKKCFLLCANCHRGVHGGYYNNPETHIFNKELAQQLIFERDERNIAHPNHCIDCGCEIDRNAKRCVECARKNRQICERPERDTLKQMIRTMPFTQIGKSFGVKDNSIRKWCISMNLPSTKKEINAYSDEDWQNL